MRGTLTLSRKQFIELQGATCANWTWSWSFVNREKRFVIFGLWAHHTEDEAGLILSRNWTSSDSGRKSPGFPQSLEHVRLVSNEGFDLLTFPIFPKRDALGNIPDNETIKIDHFEPVLQRKFLFEYEGGWYAVETPLPPANSFEPLIGQIFEEGEESTVVAKRIERSAAARARCLEIHGCKCVVCEKSMSDRYGADGEGVIDVHHLNELSLSGGKHMVDPENDLIPVCPNCHRIIHTKKPALSLEAVRNVRTKYC